MISKIAMIVGCMALSSCGQTSTKQEVRVVDADVICGNSGLNPIQPCQVSFFRALSQPDDFEGKYIQIVGYCFVIDGDQYLFATKDSADARDYPSSIALPVTDQQIASGLVRLIGKFSAKAKVPSEGEAQGAKGRPFGSMVEIYSHTGAVLLPLPDKPAP